jgi:hypothetical protein
MHAMLCVAVALGVSACGAGMEGVLCTLTVREHHTSPDGRFMAVVFDRDCGPAGATTQMSIAPAGGTIPNAPANTFIADRLSVLDVVWESPEELRLRVPPVVEAQRADTAVLGIRIRYEDRPPAAMRTPPVE